MGDVIYRALPSQRNRVAKCVLEYGKYGNFNSRCPFAETLRSLASYVTREVAHTLQTLQYGSHVKVFDIPNNSSALQKSALHSATHPDQSVRPDGSGRAKRIYLDSSKSKATRGSTRVV